MKNKMNGPGYAVALLVCDRTKISSAFGIVMKRTRRLGIESSESLPDGYPPSDNSSSRETIKRALNLPPTCVLEYKTNNGASRIVCKLQIADTSPDSMQDKSSFRTTPVVDRQ